MTEKEIASEAADKDLSFSLGADDAAGRCRREDRRCRRRRWSPPSAAQEQPICCGDLLTASKLKSRPLFIDR